MNRKTILSFWLCLIMSSIGMLTAQNLTVTGTVTDGTNGETLIGASVIQKGTTNGVITDYDGNFTISVPANAVLEVSYVGYIKKDIPVTNAGPYAIKLDPDNQQLDEVVVVGYGQQRVRDLTAPITTIKGSNLAQETAGNPTQALQGKVAGVQVTNSGTPSGGVSVKIRGVGSIGDYANPLYIVDGAFVDNIDFLSSSDIQDLTILKDASAAAIYGVRAANGVVIVTTKRGTTERATISFDTYMGVQKPMNIVGLSNTDQYIEVLNEAFLGVSGYPKSASAYSANTDW